jgi:hypothetical protein
MTTIVPTNPGWRIQLAIHRAVRRDISRLSAALAEQVPPAAAVQAYWSVTAAQLHHHHEFEDTVVWPLMGARLGARVEALLDRNSHEHEVMSAAMAQFDAAVGTTPTDTAVAAAALGEMEMTIDTHLKHEEADVLPLISEAFTMEDLAFFQAEDAKTNAANVFLPWMLEDAPETDFVFFTAAMPAPVREQLESAWMPQWVQTVDALRRALSVTATA